MGLFSRKKVAKALDLTPARVSQMANSGALIPPVEDADGTERGWPATYVEEVVATRQGRKTSRSIYGYPPQATPFTRVDDALIQVKDGGQRAFVQLVKVDAGLVGLITLLRSTIVNESPYMNSLGDRGPLYSIHGTDLLPFIHAAAERLGVDEYDVAWVRLEEIQASEVVVVTEPIHHGGHTWHSPSASRRGYEEDGKQEPITWGTLHAKLGAPVPILEIASAEAVDEWQRAGRTHTTVTLDVDNYYNRAMAASLLAQLASRDDAAIGRASSGRSDALRLAISRLEKEIKWETSGTTYESYLIRQEDARDHVAPIVSVEYPDMSRLRPVLQNALIDGDLNASRTVRQSAADTLGSLIYKVYGPFGATPTPSLVYALERGISAVVHRSLGELSAETFGDDAEWPRFYELRTFERRAYAASWNNYLDSLEEAHSRTSPDYRLLESKQHDLYSSERGEKRPSILIDGDDNHVLVQEIVGYEDKRFTRITVVVPIARLAGRDLEHLKAFDEIIVEPNTQEGPILLNVDGEMHIMPFGAPHPGGFTHGYDGHGPSNTWTAIKHFLEWAAGSRMTSTGDETLRGIVVGSDQDRPLIVGRGQIVKPGMFESITASTGTD